MHRFLFVGTSALLTGFCFGSALTAWSTYQREPIVLIEDAMPDSAAVRINGIRNGALVGSATGPVRLSAGGKIISLGHSGAFAIRDAALLTNHVSISVPGGMKFVASKRGKKYYPVLSAQGQNLKLENRVYFPNEEAAEAAGYSP